MSPFGWTHTACGCTSGVSRAGRLSKVAAPAIVSMNTLASCAETQRHDANKRAETRNPMIYLGYRFSGAHAIGAITYGCLRLFEAALAVCPGFGYRRLLSDWGRRPAIPKTFAGLFGRAAA